ncbi:MAG: hypothetical protein J5I62_06615, partial [Flavobacteriales bacterium]|nr:hypothetical protein [Flavobacteriales bacterium]
TPGNVMVYLKNDINQVLETWTANVGANGIPDTSTFIHYCTGRLNRESPVMEHPALLGVSYRMDYTVTPAFYTNDTEPNQNTSQATDTIPPGTNTDGHVAFNYDDATDYYRILAPNDGMMTVQVMAEHAGNTPGNVMVYLKNDINQVLETWTANVGANGIPDTTTFIHYCTGHLNRYYLVMENPDVCGVSYRMSYTVAPAAFANDVEENDNTSQAADTIPPGTNMDGHVDFYYDDATDYYRILAPTDGVLSVNFQAEHAAAGPGTVTVYLRNNINQTIVTWFANVGANGMAEDTTFTHNCTGHQAIYYLLVQNPDVCGVSYRMSYSVTPAVYADDAEPNQNTGQAIPIDLNNAGATGHVGFEYDNNEDFYVINHPGGDINVYTLAENAGAAGAMTVYIRNNINQTLVTGTADVGGNSIPSADTISLAGAAAGTYHIVVSNPDVCGVSYMLRCYDDDNDGVCNGSDLCPGTPNGEGVNGDGCACSQLTVDDGDPCTLDECSNGIVTHTFQDADGDLTCDAQDGCPNDPNKIAAGACGCGNPDVPTTWYADTDGDGFGDPNDSQAGFTCNQPPGYVADNTDLCPTDINKQDPGACGCGVADVATTWYADTDGDGLGDPNNSLAGFTCNQPVGYVADNTDLCPAVAGTVGSTCDDGNPNTTGDVLDGSCNCVGFLVDCEGTPGGPALPGTACDDGNANTGNDTWDGNCTCVGQLIDCLGVPGGPALPGTACDDGDANTGNDTWDGNCTCVGQLIDCLGVPGGSALPGTSCDDGNANTDNDAWDGNCTCVGTPSGGPCTGDQVMVYITTDANPGQLSWEITNDGGTVIAAGSPAAANTLVGEPACLNASPASAWYGFRLMDSNGDGISGGGWELRTTDGKLIMGDAFSDGASSPANPPLAGSYGSHHSFALPLAAPDVHPAECGVFNNRSDNKVFANKVAGTNYLGGTLNYQFEFSDPDSGYVRRIKKP